MLLFIFLLPSGCLYVAQPLGNRRYCRFAGKVVAAAEISGKRKKIFVFECELTPSFFHTPRHVPARHTPVSPAPAFALYPSAFVWGPTPARRAPTTTHPPLSE